MSPVTVTINNQNALGSWPRLAQMPTSAKMLVTVAIVALSLGLAGALGQIVVHDIIPTFFSDQPAEHAAPHQTAADEKSGGGDRGDLFGDLAPGEQGAGTVIPLGPPPEQFVWLLKWSHIHLFGMAMIFLFVGGITIFLDWDDRVKTWLVVLPFIGIWVDIGAMWLKAYVSPHFFWLHLPGGGLFGAVFGLVALRAMLEMWHRGGSRREN